MAIEPLDTAEIRKMWLTQCGPHNAGVLGTGCACPPDDPRPVILRLVEEIERYHAAPARFTDPTVVDAVEREIRKMPIDPSTCSTGCTVQYGPCARHIAEHLVNAMREERLVVLTIEAADEIIRSAWGANREGVA